ncbi:MAG: hypothetical protein E7588_08100 [Ruminococcaceae bacterium]|nr:hypothetical protein [Oscillospiraceae bacterium]
MDNKVLFRTTMGGFKKEDVISYIEKLSSDTNRMLAEKDDEIRQLKSRLEIIEKHVEVVEKKCSEAEQAEQMAKGEAQEAKRQADDYAEKIQLLELEVQDALTRAAQPADVFDTEEYKQLEEKYNAVVARSAQLEKQLEGYRDFDGVQRDLGTILIKAEKSASEITAKAKNDAQAMIDEAARVSDEITEKRIKACTAIADTFDKGKIAMDEAHCNICRQLENIKEALDAFYGSVETGRKAVHECVNSVKSVNCKPSGGFVNDNNN